MNAFIENLDVATREAADIFSQLDLASAAVPAAAQLSAEFQPAFKAAAAALTSAIAGLRPVLSTALSALRDRKAAPMTPVQVSLPPIVDLTVEIVGWRMLHSCSY